MARPLPKCALCGKSVRRAGESADGRIVITLTTPGTPSVGWHGNCAAVDSVFRAWSGAREHGELDLVGEVLRRGPGRVEAGTAFWRTHNEFA